MPLLHTKQNELLTKLNKLNEKSIIPQNYRLFICFRKLKKFRLWITLGKGTSREILLSWKVNGLNKQALVPALYVSVQLVVMAMVRGYGAIAMCFISDLLTAVGCVFLGGYITESKVNHPSCHFIS